MDLETEEMEETVDKDPMVEDSKVDVEVELEDVVEDCCLDEERDDEDDEDEDDDEEEKKEDDDDEISVSESHESWVSASKP